MASMLPAQLVRFEPIADAGHPVIDDQPEVVLHILREFIAS
jgi:pimeloyl-ACP methyl ester carboxylesterase